MTTETFRIRPRRAVPTWLVALVFAPFALAAGWMTAAVLDDLSAIPEPLAAPVAAGPVPPSPAVSVPSVVEPAPAARRPAVRSPAAAAARPPAAAAPRPVVPPAVAAAPVEHGAGVAAVPVVAAPAPAAEPAPTPARTWTAADQATAEAVCVESFGAGARALNTPAVGDPYPTGVARWPCRPAPATAPPTGA